MMDFLGFDEHDWMPKCNATYKSAIRFENFHNNNEKPIWYPFEPMMELEGLPISRYWHHQHLKNTAYADRFSFYDACFGAPLLCEHGKTVKSIEGISYAYHLDAGLFGEYLKGAAKENGVAHIVDTINDVNLGEDGSIKSLSLDNGEDLAADLFVDCSGFAALLINKHLGDPFKSYKKYLFNDSAIAIRMPYVNKELEMNSYTNCTALSSGWVWNVPLYNRIGRGYVYCSDYQGADEAEFEFRQLLGEDRVKDFDTRHLKIRHGRQENPWTKNCVAIGLSAGFIEPLESTAIQITQMGIELLTRMLSDGNRYGNTERKLYNFSMNSLFKHVRDFLVIHYTLTSRDDTAYWRDVQEKTEISDSLQQKLMLARNVLPDMQFNHVYDGALVSHGLTGYQFGPGWACILVGMNFLPYTTNAAQMQGVDSFDKQIEDNIQKAVQFFQQREKQVKELTNKLPSHYEYLKQNLYNGEE
jgi:tryptophan halogenase